MPFPLQSPEIDAPAGRKKNKKLAGGKATEEDVETESAPEDVQDQVLTEASALAGGKTTAEAAARAADVKK